MLSYFDFDDFDDVVGSGGWLSITLVKPWTEQ